MCRNQFWIKQLVGIVFGNQPQETNSLSKQKVGNEVGITRGINEQEKIWGELKKDHWKPCLGLRCSKMHRSLATRQADAKLGSPAWEFGCTATTRFPSRVNPNGPSRNSKSCQVQNACAKLLQSCSGQTFLRNYSHTRHAPCINCEVHGKPLGSLVLSY